MKIILRLLIILILLFPMISQEEATGATIIGDTSFDVLAIMPEYATVSVADMNFGNIMPFSNTDISTTLQITVVNGQNYEILLDGGSSGNAAARQMTHAISGYLYYNLYKDVSRTTVWGDTPGNGVTSTGTGSTQNHIVSGRVPSGQSLLPGVCSDTINITVNF